MQRSLRLVNRCQLNRRLQRRFLSTNTVGDHYPLIFQLSQTVLEEVRNGSLLSTPAEASAAAIAAIAGAPAVVPWWMVISGSAVVLRLSLMLPAYIVQQRAMARSLSLEKVLAQWEGPVRQSLRYEMAQKGQGAEASEQELEKMVQRRLRQQRHGLMLRQGCHPIFNFMVPLTQAPIWMSMTLTLQHMCGRPVPLLDGSNAAASIPVVPGMATEGLWWFKDLSQVDPLGFAPVVTGVLYLAAAMTARFRAQTYVQKNSPAGAQFKKNWMARSVPFIIGGASVGIAWTATKMPMGIVLYWSASALISLLQYGLLHNQRLRRLLGFLYIKT